LHSFFNKATYLILILFIDSDNDEYTNSDESVDTDEDTNSNENVDNDENTNSDESVDTDEDTNSDENVDNDEDTNSNENIDNINSDKSIDNDENSDNDENLDSNENINSIFNENYIKALNLLVLKFKHGITDIAFNDILKTLKFDISLYKLRKRLSNYIELAPQTFEMCTNSCIAYVENYRNLNSCPFCNQSRYYDNTKKPKKLFYFFSLKKRFLLQYSDKNRSKELQYRYEYISSEQYLSDNKYEDIFDGR